MGGQLCDGLGGMHGVPAWQVRAVGFWGGWGISTGGGMGCLWAVAIAIWAECCQCGGQPWERKQVSVGDLLPGNSSENGAEVEGVNAGNPQ